MASEKASLIAKSTSTDPSGEAMTIHTIAHDMANFLFGICTLAHAAKTSLPPNSSARGALQSIEKAALGAGELCDQLRRSPDPQASGEQDAQAADINLLCEDEWPLLQAMAPANVSVQIDLASPLPRAAVSPVLL